MHAVSLSKFTKFIVFKLQNNVFSGGQLPTGGRDQVQQEAGQQQQQQPGQEGQQGQYPAQQGQYPQSQGQQPQAQGQYPVQGQGQYPQDQQLNAQQQQGAYPATQDGQQGAAVAGQYAHHTSTLLTTTPTPAAQNVYNEDNNYPKQPQPHQGSNLARGVHPAFTKPPMGGQQQQSEGFRRQPIDAQLRTFNEQRNSYNHNEYIRNEYKRKYYNLNETRPRNISTNSQDQRYAPSPRYGDQDRRVNKGQGQVAGGGQKFDLEKKRVDGGDPSPKGQGNYNETYNDCKLNYTLRYG